MSSSKAPSPSKRVRGRALTSPSLKSQKHRARKSVEHTGIGAHVSIAGGYCAALDRAHEFDLDAMQIFTSSPRSRLRRAVTPGEELEFVQACETSPVREVYVHTPYYVNAASPDTRTWHFSKTYIVREIGLMAKIKARYFVMHVGSHLGSGVRAGKDKVVRMLEEVLKETAKSKVMVCLENTAGQRNDVGGKFEDMGEILGRFKGEPRIGAIMDTCHMFSAGYDLRTPEQVAKTFTLIEQTIGWKRVPMLHFNDSKTKLAGGHDRHENLGKGYIGYQGLAAVIQSPFTRGKDLILETDESGRAEDVAWLKKTVEELR